MVEMKRNDKTSKCDACSISKPVSTLLNTGKEENFDTLILCDNCLEQIYSLIQYINITYHEKEYGSILRGGYKND